MSILFGFALGIALLFWGMHLLQLGLENTAGTKFESLLRRLTTTPLSGLLTGTVITALVQSSTAITVFTLSLVNAGVMTFQQALGIILGTNIGSTITAQLMAFNLETFSLPALLIGGLLFILGRRGVKWFGLGLIGFAFVFWGIGMMSRSLQPLGSSDSFLQFLRTLGDNHLFGVLAGAILAGLIHSSSVTTGMVIVLASQHLVSLATAFAIVLGANVGTCFTALLASLSGDRGAKRVAVAHLLLNLFGVVVFFPLLNPFTRFIALFGDDLGRQVANAHTFFNVVSSLVILPLAGPFAKLVCRLVPDK